MDQIESSGDNYIRLMKSIKSCLDKTKDDTASSVALSLDNFIDEQKKKNKKKFFFFFILKITIDKYI